MNWSHEDERVLRESFPSGGIEAASVALDGRFSALAIKARAKLLGLRRNIASGYYSKWSDSEKQQCQKLRENGLSFDEIGQRLNRSPSSVMNHFYDDREKHEFSAEQIQRVRESWAVIGVKPLAIELFGSCDAKAIGQVNSLAIRFGVIQSRMPSETVQRIVELNAMGRSDGEIALELKPVLGPNARRSICALRKRLKIRAVPVTREKRKQIGSLGRQKQLNSNNPHPRTTAFKRLANQYGLPSHIPPRAVSILVYLSGGPRTRDEIRSACGITNSMLWNAHGTSYTGGLIREGLVVTHKLPSRKHKGPRVLYSLSPHAMELMKGTNHDHGNA